MDRSRIPFNTLARSWPPKTPVDSPLREFLLCCNHCHSNRVRFAASFDEEAGELKVKIICCQCRNTETIPATV